MNMKEIKGKIQLAIDIAKDVPEPFKTKAFEVVLSSLLTGLLPKESSSSTYAESYSAKGKISIETKIGKLARIASIEENQLKDIFHFGEKEPTFIGRVAGTEAERQVQMCRFILLAMHEIYECEWVKGSFLWKSLQDYGVGSLKNLSKNLERREAEFRAVGKRRGKKYKLTQQGRQNTIELLRQLVAQ